MTTQHEECYSCHEKNKDYAALWFMVTCNILLPSWKIAKMSMIKPIAKEENQKVCINCWSIDGKSHGNHYPVNER